MLPDDGLTSFNKGNSANFFCVNENKYKEAFRGVLYLRLREKNMKSNLVLVVVLVLETDGL